MSSPGRASVARPPSQRWPTRLRWHAWRWRHVLVAVAVLVAARGVVTELRPEPPATRPVVVAARALAAGDEVQANDLRVAQWPVSLWAGAFMGDPSELVGRRLAVGIPVDVPVTSAHTVGPGVASGAPPGSVVVIVPIIDAGVAAMLRPGDRVDLVATTTDPTGMHPRAHVVARDVAVLAHPPRDGGGMLMAPQSDSALLVVAVAPAAATEVIAASAWSPLNVLLRS